MMYFDSRATYVYHDHVIVVFLQESCISSSVKNSSAMRSSKNQDIEYSENYELQWKRWNWLPQLLILTLVRKTCWICCSNAGLADSMVQLYRDSQLDQTCNPCWGIVLVSVAPHCVVSIPQSMSLWSCCPSVVTLFHCCGDALMRQNWRFFRGWLKRPHT